MILCCPALISCFKYPTEETMTSDMNRSFLTARREPFRLKVPSTSPAYSTCVREAPPANTPSDPLSRTQSHEHIDIPARSRAASLKEWAHFADAVEPVRARFREHPFARLRKLR